MPQKVWNGQSSWCHLVRPLKDVAFLSFISVSSWPGHFPILPYWGCRRGKVIKTSRFPSLWYWLSPLDASYMSPAPEPRPFSTCFIPKTGRLQEKQSKKNCLTLFLLHAGKMRYDYTIHAQYKVVIHLSWRDFSATMYLGFYLKIEL